MPRYFVIANQTLAEAELMEAIRKRLETGPSPCRAGWGWTSRTGCNDQAVGREPTRGGAA